MTLEACGSWFPPRKPPALRCQPSLSSPMGSDARPQRWSWVMARPGRLTSGDVTKAWVSGFASLRPVKFLL